MNLTKIFCCISEVTWNGYDVTTDLGDGSNITCVSINSTVLDQETVSIDLAIEYDYIADVSVSGHGLLCSLDDCDLRYPTLMYQQGNSREKVWVEKGPVCLGATLCPMVVSESNDNGVVCGYRCVCPKGGSDDDESCSGIVMMLGNGSIASHEARVDICEVIVTKLDRPSQSHTNVLVRRDSLRGDDNG